jgi:HAE1 family hydrophobic/amphiphilic exporter-1
VTYALLASFVVAITVVPLLVLLFIRHDDEVEEAETVLERAYAPALKWSLVNRRNGFIVIAVAIVSMLFGFVLFGGRPAAFLPNFGEPQIGVSVTMPPGTKIIETNALALALEERIREIIPAENLATIQATVGGGGLSFESLLGGSSVNEAQAAMTIGLDGGQENLDAYTQEIRTAAEEIFGEENVAVSAASLSSQGFGGFAVVISGPQEDLEATDARIIETIASVPGITNVTSNLAAFAAGGGEDGDAPTTYIRINGETALEYTGELETQNTIGVTQQAIAAINALPDLPDTLTVSQGFETQTQVEGFQSMFVAMGISIVLMVVILIFTFGSPIYWAAIILSIVVAPVGAAVALTLTNRVLGISALIGLLMLLGIVVTNAVVLIDRVHTNDVKRRMKLDEAIEEGGERRLRPIVMTAVATIGALMPLAIGLSEGAIIASELGTVVIGGLFSSTLLTLFVVPVAYKLLHPIHDGIMNLVGLGSRRRAEPSPTGTD